MKRILMIAPGAYPVIRAEAIVNINLLRILTESGEFEIDLISRRLNHPLYPSDNLAHYGVRLNSLSIVEFKGCSNLSILWFLIKSFFVFGVCFRSCHWAAKALKVVEQKVKANHYDYVLTKATPSFILGWYLKKKYGLKWVASWNDPYPISKFPFPYGKGNSHKGSYLDRAIINKMRLADNHIFPSERLMHYMQYYLKVDENKCIIIAHVSVYHSMERHRKPDGTLRMIHLGNLLPPRDPDLFLQALAEVKKKSPNYIIHFTLLGKLEPKVRKIIKQYGLTECVNVCNPVEYRKSLELISNYDVAIIIEAPVNEGIFLPTKVGDYLNMGMPIFSVSPETGVLNDLYKNKVIGYFAPVDKMESIVEEIHKIYGDFLHNSLMKSCAGIPYSDPSYIVEQYKRL